MMYGVGGWVWDSVGMIWFGLRGAGASFDIPDDNPTHICPLPAFLTKPKALLAFEVKAKY